LQQFVAVGFTDRTLHSQLLEKHNSVMLDVLNELLASETTLWFLNCVI
jgi:hypothetical protein